ncbi:GNAT family N-acetyltransferase [Streptomyces spongiae]|uniref:GNAT family N-acetyltransferase n=1 Tax=Streptomyces spongiae TaxID=565072 RepID=A0A5N8XRF8_9ACTN|nr:GNAT family N-acetyltransferase [Streptomyces spongiae]MPY61992.1 GNAT family N-acetyltransferase [Streptomyces spongiae]
MAGGQNVISYLPGTAPLPSRVPPWQRIRLHTGYAWRNSGHPLLTGVRVAWDTRNWGRFPAVRSDVGGVSISYSGVPEGLPYALEFTEQRRESGAGEPAARVGAVLRGWDLGSPRRVPDADIVMVGTSAAKARQLAARASLVVPVRVHFVLDLDRDPEAIHAGASKGARRDFRQKSRQHDWSFGTERDPAWFEYFYDRVYRATMFERYGARARTESRESAYECLFRSGVLFHLSMDGERVAGHLCHWDPASKVLTSRLLGVLDGAEEYYAAGALKVMYFLLIDWAARNGVRRLDFQGTEAFLSKGTYQLKRRFGTRVVLPPNHFGGKRLWLQVRRDTAEVRSFLVDNPLLTEARDGTLEAVYFYDDLRPVRLDYRAESPGVGRVRHVHLDDFLTGINKDGRDHDRIGRH